MNSFYTDIGTRIKQKRLKLHWTREKLAAAANISVKFLYEVETGNKGMSAETLYKLKTALNVSADWLLDGLSRQADESRKNYDR
jgi:transcriptional regulator with XRE-family HTH domain